MTEQIPAQISVARHFQRSVRIDLDLDDLRALEGYVTVRSGLRTLNTMAAAVLEGMDYAFTWTGAYGCGKSSLALMLAALCSKKRRARQAAEQGLAIDDPENAALRHLFARPQEWERICLVGTRHALRDDLYARITGLLKSEPEDSHGLSSQALFAIFDRLLERKRVLLIIDELGKYLEAAIKDHDVHFLQELAEYAERRHGRLILIGILHQSFDAYVAWLPSETRSEWAKVQGRFANYLLEPSPYESLNLIGKSLCRTDYDGAVHEKLISDLTACLGAHSANFKEQIADVLRECLPLHGMTAVLLASFARKAYGQNERSIYSFLNSMEAYSIRDFLSHCADPESALYCPDNFYDYLRINQDLSLTLSRDSHRWAIARDLIERLEAREGDHVLEIRLLKCIALIEIFSAVFRLSPTPELLSLCVPEEQSKVDEALERLLTANMVIFRNTDSAFHLFVSSDFDFEAEFQKILVNTDFDLKLLNELSGDGSRIFARRHYLTYGSLRWMRLMLSEERDLERVLSSPEYGSEVYSAFVMVVSSEPQGLAERLSALSERFPQVVLGGIDNSEELMRKTREYQAVLKLRTHESLEGDEIGRREVQSRIDDAQEQLRSLLSRLADHCTWHYRGQNRGTLSARALSTLASDIADGVFSLSFRINSELINRSRISPNIRAAQRRLLNAMLLHGTEDRLGLEGTPPEFAIYENLIHDLGLHHKSGDGTCQISYKALPEGRLKAFYKATEGFLNGRGECTLDELYTFWSKPPIGLKAGVMPVFALVFILSNLNDYAFYDKEYYITEVTESLTDEILVYSDLFRIKSFKAGGDYAKLTANLKEALSAALGLECEARPLALARALFAFVYKLPHLTLVTTELSEKARILRSRVKGADDPIRLLYSDLPHLCPLLKDTPKELTALLKELKGFYDRSLDETANAVFRFFNEPSHGLLKLKARSEISKIRALKPRLKAFCDLLHECGTEGDLRSFVTKLITLCSETSERNWTDRSLAETLNELPKLSFEFREAECFAEVSDRSQARRMIAVTCAASAADDRTLLAEISPEDEALVDSRLGRISELMDDLSYDQKVALIAGLAQGLSRAD